MATFSVDFLGCKVSHSDAQEIRERLVRDGHAESATAPDIAVLNTCCVTHEAVRKSRQAARRAARRARRVYVTGCAAPLPRAFDGLPTNVRAAGETPGLVRLRLSSLEVNHLSDELVCAMRETGSVSSHLHVPLQSGDDRILRSMGRKYSVDTYLRRVAHVEGFNLTTDVIVGFPGEDEAAFAATMRVIEAAGITKVHVFPYSPRPGTVTASEDDVPPPVKKARSARLRALSDEKCRERWLAKVGTDDVVL